MFFTFIAIGADDVETVPTQNLNRAPARDSRPVASANVALDGTGKAAPAPSLQKPISADTGNTQLKPALSQQALQQLFKEFDQQQGIERRSLSFVVSEDIGRTIVSVIDRETDELIRQIPPEEVVRVATALQDLREQNATQLGGSGLLLEEQA